MDFTFPTVIYNRGKVLESAQEISKISRISRCFVLWEPWNWEYNNKSYCIWFSQARTPHTYIFFESGVTGKCRNGNKEWKIISKVHGHFWLKFGMVTSIYRALMLLNFCKNRGRGLGARTKLFGVSNWRKLLGSKVLGICLKLSLAKKNFP